jgi:Na+-driven multidrug efflux pump
VAFVTVFVLDFALIPNHGGVGASIASAVSYTLGGLAAAIIFGRKLGAGPKDMVPRPSDVMALQRSVMARFRPARPAPGE